MIYELHKTSIIMFWIIIPTIHLVFTFWSYTFKILKIFPSILTLAVVYLKVFISDQNQTETLFRADGVFLNF